MQVWELCASHAAQHLQAWFWSALQASSGAGSGPSAVQRLQAVGHGCTAGPASAAAPLQRADDRGPSSSAPAAAAASSSASISASLRLVSTMLSAPAQEVLEDDDRRQRQQQQQATAAASSDGPRPASARDAEAGGAASDTAMGEAGDLGRSHGADAGLGPAAGTGPPAERAAEQAPTAKRLKLTGDAPVAAGVTHGLSLIHI